MSADTMLWPFDPNWTTPYIINYEFKTEVITSRAGREQRRALRFTPRKSLEHTITLKNAAELREFNRLLWWRQDQAYFLPELTRWTDSSTTMPSFSMTMTMSTVPYWLLEDGIVVLRYGATSEIRVVEDITGDQVTFDSSSANEWPVGTRVYPALSCFIDSSGVSAPRKSNAVSTVKMRFNVDPTSEQPMVVGEADLSLNGREIFAGRPNWMQSVDVSMTKTEDNTDFDRGPVVRFAPAQFSTAIKKATFLARSNTEANDMVRFFNRMRGQQGEFYWPTGESDMVLAGTAVEGSSGLSIEGVAFAAAFAEDTVHRALIVRLHDGTTLYNAVISINAVGVNSFILCQTEWPVDLTTENVMSIEWMPAWRHATDTLSVEWLSNEVAQTQLALRTLEDLPMESV